MATDREWPGSRGQEAITRWQSTAGRAAPGVNSVPATGPTSTGGLSTTLSGELSTLRHTGRCDDVLEVLASCLRLREPALILLQHRGRLWPLTVFPREDRYHLPRPILQSLARHRRDLAVVAVEPAAIAPEAGGRARGDLRPLAPLLWALARHVPRPRLLDALRGDAAFRLSPAGGAGLPDFDEEPDPAVRHALERLRSEPAMLARIARWPGMDSLRAVRLLNGAYLRGGLMVLHHRAAGRGRFGGGALGAIGAIGAIGEWWPAVRQRVARATDFRVSSSA